MKKRLIILAVVFAMLAGVAFQGVLTADDSGGSKHPAKCEMLKKIKMIFFNKKEIGLTEEQIEKLADIKHGLMKDEIALDSQVEILVVDIKTLLSKEAIDLDKIKPLVEKKYELKKEAALKGIEALANAKKVLTPEQNKKLKELEFEAWKSHLCSGASRGKGKACPLGKDCPVCPMSK